MKILCLLAIGYVSLFALYLVCGSLIKMNLSRSNILIPMVILAFAMAIIAFNWEPSDLSADLNRHFYSYSCMSGENGTLIQKTSIAEKLATGLFTWAGVILLSIKLGNPHFIPFIMVLINYLFFALSCYEISKKYSIKAINFLFFLIIKIGLVSWFHVFSGLRNTCAFSILTYSILLFCKDYKKNKTKIIICCILAVTIHPSAWIIVVFLLLSKIQVKKSVVYIVLSIWSFFSMLFVKILSYVPISSIQYIAQKILSYYGFGADKALEWRIYLVSLVFVILFFIQILFIVKNSNICFNIFENNYNNFLLMIGFFLIGSILLPTMLMRFTYLIGFMFLPVVIQGKDKLKRIDCFLFNLGEILLCLLMCAYNWVALTSHMHLG